MTSTNGIDTDVEAIKENALADLSPEKRATLGVRLRAAGEYDRLEELREAAPVKTYDVSDLDFHRHEETLRSEALYALWELDTGAWKFLYELKDSRLREMEFLDFPDEEWTEEPTEENGYLEHRSVMRAISLLVDYQAWDRVATGLVGVTLAEYLAHPLDAGEADQYVGRIEQTVEMAEGHVYGFDDIGPEAAAINGDWTPDDLPTTIEDLVNEKYAKIAASREDELR